MSTIKNIVVNSVSYDVEDSFARSTIAEMTDTTYTFVEDSVNHTLTIVGTDGSREVINLGEDISAERIIEELGYTPANVATLPTELSAFSDDATHRLVTDSEKAAWNNKVDKVSGKSLISDTEIERLANVDNYNDSALSGRVSSLEEDIAKKAYQATTLLGYGIGDAYTKSEIDTKLGTKDAAGAAETAESNAKSYTDTKIADLINGAPETLDTLKEIAEAMAEDKKVVDALNVAIGTKVDKVDGKQLSTNDFNNSYKSAIDNLPASYAPVNAQENIIETVKVNGSALTPASKAVNITVPTQPSDINAMAASVTHLSGDVPTTRTINGKALSADITLSPSDVGALPSGTFIPTVTDTYSATSSDGMSGKAVASAISSKQGNLSADQMNAVNSGITSTKVNTYDGYAATIASKGTYTKPSTGIPKTDLSNEVQTSLSLANSALQSHQDISGKENNSNKVTSWSSTTTDAHYPSEKLVKTALDAKANSADIPTVETTAINFDTDW